MAGVGALQALLSEVDHQTAVAVEAARMPMAQEEDRQAAVDRAAKLAGTKNDAARAAAAADVTRIMGASNEATRIAAAEEAARVVAENEVEEQAAAGHAGGAQRGRVGGAQRQRRRGAAEDGSRPELHRADRDPDALARSRLLPRQRQRQLRPGHARGDHGLSASQQPGGHGHADARTDCRRCCRSREAGRSCPFARAL